MTAITTASVRCDGTVPGGASGSAGKSCPEMVEGGRQPDGSWAHPRTEAEARRLARSRGWLLVRYPLLRGRRAIHYDYCPAHADQAQAKADALGVKLTRPKVKQEPDAMQQEG